MSGVGLTHAVLDIVHKGLELVGNVYRGVVQRGFAVQSQRYTDFTNKGTLGKPSEAWFLIEHCVHSRLSNFKLKVGLVIYNSDQPH